MFGVSRRSLLAEVQHLRQELDQLRRVVSAEVQHLREQLAPAMDEAAAIRLRRLLNATHQVAHMKIKTELPAAQAIAESLQSVLKPLPYGVANGRARARYAWRYDDGTFMAYDDEERIELEARERMARGGRGRARGARRAADGRFL